MVTDPKTNTLTSKILKTEDVSWRDIKYLQQDNFKELSSEDKQKLKNSLLRNEFVQPFYVWQDADDTLYCLDGKHRVLLLQELANDGVQVPEALPGIFIECASKQEASKLVLVFSSAYARVTIGGFQDFITLHELDAVELMEQISIPDLTIPEIMPLPEVLDADAKAKPATMKITFSNHQQLEEALPTIEELLKKYTGSFFSVSAGEI